jgi:hypothetical protein
MRLSRMHVARGFQLQVMSPLGRYPDESIILKRAALIISPKLCFSIIRISRKDLSFSEVDLLSARQIPFLGSILLANVGYPYPMQSVSAHEDDPEISSRCISKCRALLMRQLPAYSIEFHRSAYLHRPPALGGPEYRFHDVGDSTGVVSDWLKLINRQDAVFLRGLASFT